MTLPPRSALGLVGSCSIPNSAKADRRRRQRLSSQAGATSRPQTKLNPPVRRQRQWPMPGIPSIQKSFASPKCSLCSLLSLTSPAALVGLLDRASGMRLGVSLGNGKAGSGAAVHDCCFLFHFSLTTVPSSFLRNPEPLLPGMSLRFDLSPRCLILFL